MDIAVFAIFHCMLIVKPRWIVIYTLMITLDSFTAHNRHCRIQERKLYSLTVPYSNIYTRICPLNVTFWTRIY